MSRPVPEQSCLQYSSTVLVIEPGGTNVTPAVTST